MLGASRAFGEFSLGRGEGFVEQVAAGRECAFDVMEEGAVEVLEAKDEVEGGGGQGEGFEVGFDEKEAFEIARDGKRAAYSRPYAAHAARGGVGGGTREGCRSVVYGDDGPAAFR